MSDTQPHPLRPPMTSLLRRLTVLNGFVHLLANQLDNFGTSFRRGFAEHGLDISQAFAGFALIIPDLTSPQDRHFVDYLPGGTFSRVGEEYILAADELIGHWAAWTVAQCYEAFETFLRDVAAHYYYAFRPTAQVGTLQLIPIAADDIDAWKRLFRTRQWNPFTILEVLRLSAPAIIRRESDNILRLDLLQWHSLFAAVRHGVTHEGSRIPAGAIRASQHAVDALLPSAFPGAWQDQHYVLQLSQEHAEEVIRITGAYAYMIFKELCMQAGIEATALPIS